MRLLQFSDFYAEGKLSDEAPTYIHLSFEPSRIQGSSQCWDLVSKRASYRDGSNPTPHQMTTDPELVARSQAKTIDDLSPNSGSATCFVNPRSDPVSADNFLPRNGSPFITDTAEALWYEGIKIERSPPRFQEPVAGKLV